MSRIFQSVCFLTSFVFAPVLKERGEMWDPLFMIPRPLLGAFRNQSMFVALHPEKSDCSNSGRQKVSARAPIADSRVGLKGARGLHVAVAGRHVFSFQFLVSFVFDISPLMFCNRGKGSGGSVVLGFGRRGPRGAGLAPRAPPAALRARPTPERRSHGSPGEFTNARRPY